VERNVVIFMKSGIERCGRNSLKPVVLSKPHGGTERNAEEPHSLWSLYQPIYTTDTIAIWSKEDILLCGSCRQSDARQVRIMVRFDRAREQEPDQLADIHELCYRGEELRQL